MPCPSARHRRWLAAKWIRAACRRQSRRWHAQQEAVQAARLGIQAVTLAQGEKLATRSDVSQSQRRLAQELQALVGIAHEAALAWVRLRAQQGEDPAQIARSFDEWLRASR